MIQKESEFRKLGEKKLSKIICEYMGWEHVSSSKPIDAWTTNPVTKEKIKIEFKNETAGKSAVKQLAGELNKGELGFLVAWGFSKGKDCAYTQLLKAEKDGKKIEFKDIREILKDYLVPRMLLEDMEAKKYDVLYSERTKGNGLKNSLRKAKAKKELAKIEKIQTRETKKRKTKKTSNNL